MTTAQLLLIHYSSFVTVVSFVNLIRLDYWWIRVWDFPHLQVAMLALIGLLAWLVLGRNVQWPVLLLPVGLVAASLYKGWLILSLHASAQERGALRTPKDGSTSR